MFQQVLKVARREVLQSRLPAKHKIPKRRAGAIYDQQDHVPTKGALKQKQ